MNAVPPQITLAPGDRGPNFLLPDTTGRVWMFYERVRGNPFILLFVGDAAEPAGREALSAAAALQDRYEAAGYDIFAVVIGEAGAAEAAARASGGRFMIFADPLGKITGGYLAASGLSQAGRGCLLFDANQRLLMAEPLAADSPGRALERLVSLCPAAEGRIAASVAPVLIVPRVLDAAWCRDLIARWESDHEEGTVGSVVGGTEVTRVYHDVKRRRDHRIMDTEVNRQLADLIGRRIAPELNKAFCFREFRFDRFIVTCYDAERGDYFRRHRDNISPETSDRRFALTLNLNTEEFEGGELWFPEYGPDRYRPETGAAIVFSCSLLHEALPVTKGRRFTLLNFLRDLGERRAVPVSAAPPPR